MYTINEIVNRIFLGDSQDVLGKFTENSVQCVITSPEYYGNQRWEHGSLEEFLEVQRGVFSQVFRILRDDGTVFVNINDKSINGAYLNVPNMVDFELRKIGFVSPEKPIIWYRDTALPNSGKLQDVYEYIFVYAKNLNPKFDKEKLRTKAKYNDERKLDKLGLETKSVPNVWEMNKLFTNGTSIVKTHSCPFPRELVERCVVLATDDGDVVLDPFMGSGTTAYVAKSMGRKYSGVEINREYFEDCLKNIEMESSVRSVSKIELGIRQRTLF
jgi:DNA modification methylase